MKRLFVYDNFLIFVFLLLVIIPILTVFSYIFAPSTELWGHLADNLLYDYVFNTLFIVFFVSIFSTIIGVSCAWIVVMYDFKWKHTFKWLLVMPIALPTYISAYIYVGIMEPSGFIFEFFETNFKLGENIYRSINFQNIYGAIFILTICLYPYIYLLCYSSFNEQSSSAIEVSKSLGLTQSQSFRKIALPLARPAIFGGLALVIMETLAEFGTMDYYGIATFTTGIYRTWFAFGDESSALHLASILLTFVFLLIIFEKSLRGSRQYYNSSQKNNKSCTIMLSANHQILAFLWCMLICMLGFLIPIFQLLLWFLKTYNYLFTTAFFQIVINTVFIALVSALVIVLISIISSYKNRTINNFITNMSLKIFSIGYSIPGVVVAVGIIIFVTLIDEIQSNIWGSPFFYLSGSLISLFIAYLVRFSSLSHNTVESGLTKVKKNIDLTIRLFGLSSLEAVTRVHFPMMKTTIITALILVFVDIVKELPATLILRPFNFDTLAIHIYELASSEQLFFIASPSLMLIIISIIPVIILINKTINDEEIKAQN